MQKEERKDKQEVCGCGEKRHAKGDREHNDVEKDLLVWWQLNSSSKKKPKGQQYFYFKFETNEKASVLHTAYMQLKTFFPSLLSSSPSMDFLLNFHIKTFCKGFLASFVLACRL